MLWNRKGYCNTLVATELLPKLPEEFEKLMIVVTYTLEEEIREALKLYWKIWEDQDTYARGKAPELLDRCTRHLVIEKSIMYSTRSTNLRSHLVKKHVTPTYVARYDVCLRSKGWTSEARRISSAHGHSSKEIGRYQHGQYSRYHLWTL